jgi:streptomycin 6-kinase
VIFAERGSEPVVLQVGLPEPEQLTKRVVLALYDSRGAARFLATDAAHCGMLIERVSPGAWLRDCDDDGEAGRVFGRVANALARDVPKDHEFPHYWEWLERAFERFRSLGRPRSHPGFYRHLQRAEQLRHKRVGEDQLIHGDLHHENIIRCGDGLRSIRKA